MHPSTTHELARIKIAEQMQYADHQRRAKAARQAVSSGPRSIDAVPLRGRIRRTLLRLGHGTRGAPAGAGV